MSYDPTIGRWTSEDPIAFEGGDANLYRYVGNSPTNFTDPDGRQAVAQAPDPTGRHQYFHPSRYIPINLYIDRRTMPADFNASAVQDMLQQILNNAGVQACVNVIPTTTGLGGLRGLGLLGTTSGPNPNHGLQEAPLLGFGFYFDFVTANRPSYIAQTLDGERCHINLTSIGAYRPIRPARNRDVLYTNILLHEALYHGFMGNYHIPFFDFESTPFGQSTGDFHRPTELTPNEARDLQDRLHPEDRFPTGVGSPYLQ